MATNLNPLEYTHWSLSKLTTGNWQYTFLGDKKLVHNTVIYRNTPDYMAHYTVERWTFMDGGGAYGPIPDTCKNWRERVAYILFVLGSEVES